jgi:hypothetical protein
LEADMWGYSVLEFSLCRRDPVLQLQFLLPPRVVLLCSATQSDRCGVATSRFLALAAACVLLVSSTLSVVDCIGVAASRLR